MTKTRTIAVVALLPALLACSAFGVCWMTFAPGAGHGCCEQASDSLRPAPESCASLVVGATVPTVHAPEAWAASLPEVGFPGERRTPHASAPVLPPKAPPLVLRV